MPRLGQNDGLLPCHPPVSQGLVSRLPNAAAAAARWYVPTIVAVFWGPVMTHDTVKTSGLVKASVPRYRSGEHGCSKTAGSARPSGARSTEWKCRAQASLHTAHDEMATQENKKTIPIVKCKIDVGRLCVVPSDGHRSCPRSVSTALRPRCKRVTGLCRKSVVFFLCFFFFWDEIIPRTQRL